MITNILAKLGMPLVYILIGLSAGSFGTQYLQKAPVVKITEKECPKCPEPKPCNGIDFDKIKSKSLTIQNEQFLTVNGDSLFGQKIVDELKAEMQRLRLARCK